MTMDVDSSPGEGLKQYYITKCEELQLQVNEKTQNLRRLEAQRNELNSKGNSPPFQLSRFLLIVDS